MARLGALLAITATMIGGVALIGDAAEAHRPDRGHYAMPGDRLSPLRVDPAYRLMGFGCQGTRGGVIFAMEEDEFPRCARIVPVPRR